jgi:hypothetical protein
MTIQGVSTRLKVEGYSFDHKTNRDKVVCHVNIKLQMYWIKEDIYLHRWTAIPLIIRLIEIGLFNM